MDVNAANALSLYTYQSNLQGSGAGSALLDSLGSAYGTAATTASGQDSDSLSALAGASAVGALTQAVNTVAQGTGSVPQTGAVAGLSTAPSAFGTNPSSVTSLLASLGSTSNTTSGLQGFDSAVNGDPTLAVAAYQSQQAYPATTPAAQTSPSTTPTTTVGADAATTAAAGTAAAAYAATAQTTASYVEQEIQAAMSPTSLSLLA